MTKPAAVFLQLMGVVLMFLAFPFLSWTVFFIGVALVVFGGIGTRRRIRDEREDRKARANELLRHYGE